MVFGGWTATLEIVVRSAVAYAAVLVALRVIGEQVLAKMSGYDVIVTIALGSVVASIAFTADVSLVEGVAAILTLLVMQEGVRFAQARWRSARKLVAEPPRLVLWSGTLLQDRVDRWHISEEEIHAAVRRAGIASCSEVQAVVLENDGEWSVIRRRECGADLSALEDLDIPDETELSASAAG